MTAIHSHLERPEWRWSKCHRPCQHRPLSKTRCGDPDVTDGWGTPTSSKLVLHKPMAVPKFWETARLGMNHVEFSYLQKNGWVASYAWTSWSQKVMAFFKLFFARFWTAAVGGFPRMKHPLPRMVKVFPGLRCSTRPDTLPWNTSMTAPLASATGSLAKLWAIQFTALDLPFLVGGFNLFAAWDDDPKWPNTEDERLVFRQEELVLCTRNPRLPR